jgi:hypothetical protein
MLISDRINNLIIIKKKMKTLRTNYLGKYLEQYPKVSIKSILQSVEFKIKEEILNIELEGIEIIKTSANYG